MKSNRIRDERGAAIMQYWREGWQQKYIAKMVGCHPNTVYRHVKRMKEAGLATR